MSFTLTPPIVRTGQRKSNWGRTLIIDNRTENHMVLPYADDNLEIDLMNQPEQAVAKAASQIINLGVTDDVLRALVEKHKDIADPAAGPEEYLAVVAAIKECRDLRGEVEAKRKEAKADIVRRGKLIDGESNRIKNIIFGVENPMKDAKQAVDDAEAEAEAKRIGAINERIRALTVDGVMFDESIQSIETRLDAIKATPIDKSFDEFYHDADAAKQKSLSILTQALKSAQDREAEAKRLNKQKEEQAAEQKRLDAEREAREAEQRAADDARLEELAGLQAAKAKLEEGRKALEQDKEDARLEQEAQENLAAEKKEIEEQQAADAKLREELAPDKKKLEGLAVALINYPLPKVKSSAANIVLVRVIARLEATAEEIRDDIGGL